MNTLSHYLSQQATHLARLSSRIKDFHVFDFNYIPDEPLMREEAKPIIDACLRYLHSGIPNHLCLFGARGCGKTLMVRYITKLLAQSHRLRVVYANCRQHNTSFKILAHFLGVRPRGCSLDELFCRFTDQHPGPAIVILDEIDLLSDKDRNRDILYLLSRSPNNYMAILLSNHPRFLSTVDESVKSTLQPELIHFHNYDTQQVLQILEARAQLGLRDHDQALLARIAALTARATNSDVRVAIKTLYYTAIEQTADAEACFQRARRDLISDVLADLNECNLMILRAALTVRDPFVKAVYGQYRHICRDEGREPFSYVYFYSNLSYLQSIGLIMLSSTKVGRSYTNRVELLFHAEPFERAWQARFG